MCVSVCVCVVCVYLSICAMLALTNLQDVKVD